MLMLIVLTFLLPFAEAQNDASAFCFDCAGRRNGKDLYADPDNCHKYYQCFYHGESSASGYHRSCPPFQFWSEKLLTCVPEASGKPCQDPCQLQNGTKCYKAQDSGQCASFFICANTASYPMCCPEGTAFAQATCGCELDATCQDQCELPGAFAQSTTTVGPQLIDVELQVCRDTFGNFLRVVDGEPSSFWQYQYSQNAANPAFGDRRRIKQQCPGGLDFNINTCSCSVEWLDKPLYKRQGCLLYLPFDLNFDDFSSNRFHGSAFGDATVDNNNHAHGTGSLRLNGQGRVEIAGFKSLSIRGSVSWCLAYRCPNDGNCTGGLVSNSGGDDHLSFSIGLRSDATVEAKILFANPHSTIILKGPVSQSSTFNQICVVFDADKLAVSLYVNGEEAVQSASIDEGQLETGHCPYTIGADSFYGNFAGFIDDVLVCPWAFNGQDLGAHSDGPDALVNRDYIPDNAIFVDRGYEIKTFQSELLQDSSLLRKLIGRQNGVGYRFMEVAAGGFPGFALATILKRDNVEKDAQNFAASAMQTCAGVLIKNSWMLLSARCLVTKLQGEISEFVISFGFNNSDQFMSTIRQGSRYFVHGAFKQHAEIGEASYDFALVKFDRPIVKYNGNMYPMRIPDPITMCTARADYLKQTDLTKIDGETRAVELGYEYAINDKPLYNNYTGEIMLKTGPVTFISRDECTSQFGWHTIVPDTQLCAIDRNSLVIRQLDSSVSRLLIKPGTTDSNGFKTDYILGLLYDVIDSPSGNPVYMYSRVCRIYDWIAVTTKRN